MTQLLVQKIRDIQRQEGNSACFRTGKSQCPFEQKCVWAEVCLTEQYPRATWHCEVAQ